MIGAGDGGKALEGRREGGEWEHVTSLLRENLHVGGASTEPPTARQSARAVIGQTGCVGRVACESLTSLSLLSAFSLPQSPNTHSLSRLALPSTPHHHHHHQSHSLTTLHPRCDAHSPYHISHLFARLTAFRRLRPAGETHSSEPATLPAPRRKHPVQGCTTLGHTLATTCQPTNILQWVVDRLSRPKTSTWTLSSTSTRAALSPSPINPTSSRPDATPQAAGQDWNSLSPFDQPEERQHFSGPSHDYTQYKQQVGLPIGSLQSMPMNQPQMMDGFNSGIDMNMDAGFANGWSSGIDMDAEMGMDFNQPQPTAAMPPPMFFPPGNETPTGNFVNPNTLGGQDEPASNVGRLWPGMHSQQAQQVAMQKAAQTQAMQQRQMKLQAQQQQYRQAANASQTQSQGSSAQQQSHGNVKRPSHATEPHVEESISRLLNQMRNNSTASADDAGSPDNLLPQIARMRKDEEEMDEDERLLASEEGKKLSSKERRQLRNKVSARAFRSRRKEYIGQLEGEIALKTQDANNLRGENTALLQENERYRGLIETLLRHPAFTPFLNDLSADPSSLGLGQLQQKVAQPTPTPQQPVQQQQPQQQQAPPQPQPQQEDVKPEFMNFDASQLQIPQQQPQAPPAQQQTNGNERVGLAMIPENDFSKLNINNIQPMNNYGYQSVNAFPVTNLPAGPNPADLLASYSTSASSISSSTTACSPDLNVLLSRLDNSARTISS
ncbi:hypothetical protein Q7P37_010959 [Cladosporium fusiforme]